MSGERWLRVPVGDEAARWRTVGSSRTVLAVARTVTSAGRLLEILPLFRSDPRVQVLFTVVAGSAFDDGVGDYLLSVQARTVPWSQAVETPFHLAAPASANGALHQLKAPLLVVPHGAGYNRLLSPADGPESGVSGLARHQLVHEGRVVPATIAPSHHEQLSRLERECPEALPRAVVVGDLVFDRIRANLARRDRYRRALGVGPDRKLVLVSSTWGAHSLLGANGDVVARLVAELPVDEYQVVLAAHPNAWFGHGGLQVRLWLADARDGGLLVLPPQQGWQAALVASDVIVGDHGSVTFYGAALGRPVLLASSGREAEELDPGSPTALLSGTLPRLDPAGAVLSQIEQAMAAHGPHDDVAGRTLGMPGQAGGLLRRLAYRLMELPEPAAPATARPLAEPLPERGEVLSFEVEAVVGGGCVTVRRYPAVLERRPGGQVRDPHLVVDAEEVNPRLLENAAIVVGRETRPGWAQETLRRYPGCFMTAEIVGDRSVDLTLRDGERLRVGITPARGGDPDPRCLPSAVYGWLVRGRSREDLHSGITVRVGDRQVVVNCDS
ncbi:hypothetical protein [Nonomuraea sp. NPDC003201]